MEIELHTARSGNGRHRITVVGCGHVGVVMAAGFANLGHDVIGLDRDVGLVAELSRGSVRIQEAGLPALVRDGLESGRLRFTTSYADGIPTAEFIFLAVDTPETLGGASDLRSLRAATTSLAGSLDGIEPLVVNKSTVPIGTGDLLEAVLRRETPDGKPAPRVVSNPEFLQQGRAVRDFFEPSRIVVGAESEEDARAVASLYDGLPGEVLLTSRRTAEMIKYVANAFLATRVSFINEIAHLCESMGVDVDEVVAGVAQDERIGAHFFRPGIGYGGSCLPKDTAALRFMGGASGVQMPLLAAVQEVNDAARNRVVQRLREALGPLEGARIGVWGLTFKADTEDLRNSPAMEVVQLLANEGAIVTAYDPSLPSVEDLPAWARVTLAPTALGAVDGADALAVLTDWSEFSTVPLDQVAARMRGDVVIDGRNVIDPAEARRQEMRYRGVGRGRARLVRERISADLEAVPA